LANRCCSCWLLETRFRFNIKMILHKQRRRAKKNFKKIIKRNRWQTAGFVRFPMLISVYGQLRFRPHATDLCLFFRLLHH